MNKALLLIGGNIEERTYYLQQAIENLEIHVGRVVKKSSIYETQAWGFSDANFLNQALEVETKLSPYKLLESINTIEEYLGRLRQGNNYSSRTMDIDMLFYNNEIIDNPPKLIIPHPRLHLRNFTLIPLAEISPQYIHPKFNESISSLLKHSPDAGEVWKFIE